MARRSKMSGPNLSSCAPPASSMHPPTIPAPTPGGPKGRKTPNTPFGGAKPFTSSTQPRPQKTRSSFPRPTRSGF